MQRCLKSGQVEADSNYLHTFGDLNLYQCFENWSQCDAFLFSCKVTSDCNNQINVEQYKLKYISKSTISTVFNMFN